MGSSLTAVLVLTILCMNASFVTSYFYDETLVAANNVRRSEGNHAIIESVESQKADHPETMIKSAAETHKSGDLNDMVDATLNSVIKGLGTDTDKLWSRLYEETADSMVGDLPIARAKSGSNNNQQTGSNKNNRIIMTDEEDTEDYNEHEFDDEADGNIDEVEDDDDADADIDSYIGEDLDENIADELGENIDDGLDQYIDDERDQYIDDELDQYIDDESDKSESDESQSDESESDESESETDESESDESESDEDESSDAVEKKCHKCTGKAKVMSPCVTVSDKICCMGYQKKDLLTSPYHFDCSYEQQYQCKQTQMTCECDGYVLLGSTCHKMEAGSTSKYLLETMDTDCGGCGTNTKKCQSPCYHQTNPDHPYCCKGFKLRYVHAYKSYRCRRQSKWNFGAYYMNQKAAAKLMKHATDWTKHWMNHARSIVF